MAPLAELALMDEVKVEMLARSAVLYAPTLPLVETRPACRVVTALDAALVVAEARAALALIVLTDVDAEAMLVEVTESTTARTTRLEFAVLIPALIEASTAARELMDELKEVLIDATPVLAVTCAAA